MARLLVAVIALVALLSVASAATYKFRSIVPKQGVSHTCHRNAAYRMTYNVHTLDDSAFVELDNVTQLTSVLCDIDQTKLLLSFTDAAAATQFAAKMVPHETFVASTQTYQCEKQNDLVLRRVLAATVVDNTNVELEAVVARYDEIFENADLNIASLGPCVDSNGRSLLDLYKDNHICLGVNTESCARAKAPIPIYTNQYVDIQCSNCFAAFTADVFVDLQIRGWHLQELAGGLKNLNMLGSFVFDMNAHAAWSAGVDKTVNVATETTLLNFHIGVVPVHVWFSLPVEIKADASFQATAQATLGAQADWALGDLYVSWDPTHHWQAVTPKPVFHWTPQVSGSAQFNGQSSLAVIPTLNFHVDNFFSSYATVNPRLDMTAQGSTQSGQICADLKYDVSVTVGAQLEIDIAWLHIKNNEVYGPKVVYDSGVQTIGHYCSKAQ